MPSDSFTRADATTLGANWTILKGLADSCGIFSNQVDIDNTGPASGNYWNADAAAADQYSQAKVVTVAARTMAVVVRTPTSGTTQNYYAGGHDTNNFGNTHLRIWSMVAGVQTSLAEHASISVTAGTTLKLTAQGTTLKLFVDGVERLSVTDSALATGQPGILADHGTANVALWDDWEGGSTVTQTSANAPGTDGEFDEDLLPNTWFLRYVTTGIRAWFDRDLLDVIVAGGFFSKTLTETATLADALQKDLSRLLSQTITLADTRTAALARLLSETITLLDAISKNPAKPLVEAATLSDALRRDIGKLLSETATLTESRSAALSRLLTQVVTLVDTLSKTPTKTFSEGVTVSDSLLRAMTKQLTELASLSDARSMALSRALLETTVLVESRNISLARVLLDTASLADVLAVVRAFFKTLTETATVSAALSKSTGKVATETATLLEQRSIAISRALSEALSALDVVQKAIVKIPLTEATALADLLAKATAVSLSESVSLAATFIEHMAYGRVLIESAIIDEALRKDVAAVLDELTLLVATSTGTATGPGQWTGLPRYSYAEPTIQRAFIEGPWDHLFEQRPGARALQQPAWSALMEEPSWARGFVNKEA